MNVQQYPLKKGQYFPDLTTKKFVVWHGTAGRTLHTPVSGRPGKATTSIDAWNLNADRVGAPWLVDRDGTIYQTFNDSAWIFHLGLKGVKGLYDKQSVAIEFANEGPLDLDGDRLYAFGMNTPNTVYNGPFINARLARLQLLRADGRGASRCRDRAHARRLPPPQDRARSSTTRQPHSTSRAASRSRRSSVTPTAAPTRPISVCRSGCSRRSKRPASASPHEGAAPWTRSFGSSSLRCETFRLHAAALAARRSARISASRIARINEVFHSLST